MYGSVKAAAGFVHSVVVNARFMQTALLFRESPAAWLTARYPHRRLPQRQRVLKSLRRRIRRGLSSMPVHRKFFRIEEQGPLPLRSRAAAADETVAVLQRHEFMTEIK